jgi:hypothetical protein
VAPEKQQGRALTLTADVTASSVGLEAKAVAPNTVFLYSSCSRLHLERAMSIAYLRQNVQPKPDRLPRWVRRIWHWF